MAKELINLRDKMRQRIEARKWELQAVMPLLKAETKKKIVYLKNELYLKLKSESSGSSFEKYSCVESLTAVILNKENQITN